MKFFNKTILATGVAALAALAYTSGAMAAGDSFSGGKIHFHGVIIDGGCTIDGASGPDLSSYVKEVAMGSYQISDFASLGALAGSGAVDASLSLSDCPAGVTGVGVTLTSNEGESLLTGNFAPATGAGAETGVALQMQYGASTSAASAGDQIMYGVESAKFPIAADGTGTVALQAQYIAEVDPGTTPITPGTADNTIVVGMSYY